MSLVLEKSTDWNGWIYQHRRPKIWLFHQHKQNLACHQGGVPLKYSSSLVDMDVKVIAGGRPYLRAALGAVLGTEEYTQAFMTGKVLQ